MARMRTVKPEFFRSATIGRLSRDARLLFIGMWTEADDQGRGLAEPRHLAGSLFPFDRDLSDKKIAKLLRELEQVVTSDGARGLVVRYEANGSTYYAVRNWWHQKVNRPKPARYPAPPSETLFNDAALSSAPSESVTRHRIITDSSVNGARQGSGVRDQEAGGKESVSRTSPKPRGVDATEERLSREAAGKERKATA